jgi:serine/threonine protein kinase
MTDGVVWTGPAESPSRFHVRRDRLSAGPGGSSQGGQGIVYEAVDTGNGATVALKAFTATGVDDNVIAQRHTALTALSHPNLMRHLGVFYGAALNDRPDSYDPDTAVLYSVSEWVEGSNLVDAVADASPEQALGWVAGIASAVGYLHQIGTPAAPTGIIHRDIKPDNVRVTPEGVSVLIDFGTVRSMGRSDLTAGVGTHAWMAPEVAGPPGKGGKPADVWAVGALAYWALLGRAPRLEALSNVRDDITKAAIAARLPNPGHVASHIASALQLDPERRPTNLTVWGTRLQHRVRSRRRRRYVLVPVAALACAGVIGSAAYFGSGGDPSGVRVAPVLSSSSASPLTTTTSRTSVNESTVTTTREITSDTTLAPPVDGNSTTLVTMPTSVPAAVMPSLQPGVNERARAGDSVIQPVVLPATVSPPSGTTPAVPSTTRLATSTTTPATTAPTATSTTTLTTTASTSTTTAPVSVVPAGTRIDPGTVLAAGQTVRSPNGWFELIFQYDGNLVVYQAGNRAALWNTATWITAANGTASVLPNCAIEIRDEQAAAVKTIPTAGNTGCSLSMRNDGTLTAAIGNADLWATPAAQGGTPRGIAPAFAIPTYANSSVGTTMTVDTVLPAGKAIYSPNGWYRLYMQQDGNLVLYKAGERNALWHTNTWGTATGGTTTIGPRCALVVRNATQSIVTTVTTNGPTDCYLLLQNDGNLAVYSGMTAFWYTGAKTTPTGTPPAFVCPEAC